MLRHIIFGIWILCLTIAYINTMITKRKRKKLLMEKETAYKRYAISICLFVIPTALIFLLVR